MRLERARTRRGLCQEYEKCKEQREELSRQRKELEGRVRREVKKFKIKRRILKVKKLKQKAVSIQTLTLQEDEIGYGVSYESNRCVNVRVSYFPVLGLYALL